jgi:hypothetical protein
MGNRAEVELGFDDKEVAAGIARTEKRMEALGKNLAKSGKGSSGPFDKIMDIAAGAVTIDFFKSLADEIGHVTDQADKLNTSSEVIQRLTNFADPTGTDIDAVTSALTKLNRALRDGDDPKANRALQGLGISADELIRMEPDQQILKLNAAFQQAQQSGKGFNEIFDLMGKNGSALLPILRMNHDELESLQGMHVVSNEDARNIDALGDAWAGFYREFKAGMATMIMTAPKLNDALSSGLAEMFTGGTFAEGFRKTAEAQKDAAKTADEADQKKRQQIKDAEAAIAAAQKQAAVDELNLQLMNSTATAMEKVENLQNELSKFDKSGTIKQGSMKSDLENLQEFVKLTNELTAARKAAISEAQRMEGIVKGQRKAKEGLEDETADLKIQELRQSRRFAAADRLERAKKRAMNERKIRDAHPTMNDNEVKAMAKRQADIDDRARGIIGKTKIHESADSWGLHAKPRASALDALKGRLDMNAHMGPSHLKNKLVGNREGEKGKQEVKMTDAEAMNAKLERIATGIEALTAY